jgi:uncharacterized protein (DUF885 family)
MTSTRSARSVPRLAGHVVLVVVALSATAVTQTPATNQTTKDFHALFAEERVHELQRDPVRSSNNGDWRWNDRWPDVSLAAIAAEKEHLHRVIARLDAVNQSELSAADQLNYSLFRMQRDQELEEHELRWYLLPVRHNVGIHLADQVANSLPFQTLKDYDDWLSRVRSFPVYMDQAIALMREGIRARMSAVAVDTVAGYYGRGTPDGTRAGTLFVNVSKPETRPKYEMLTLALHEGVPGHHIQRSIAMELMDVPALRIDERFPVFSEGWALYAESLADDMGLTSDPYAKFGRLSGEMWRAVRLVVDTGIHWAHWDRQRAIDYFKEQTARPESDIEQEIDRYSEILGQALAYKTGEMKIKELRARADAALGPRFSLREFNSVVLELGTVPLGPLERHVDAWIATRRTATPLLLSGHPK